MAKTSSKDSPPSPRDHIVVIPEEDLTINLKDRWLAAFLAWLIPGLGHIYQGRTAKGILFMVCILGTFLYGLFALGDGKVVYASVPGERPHRWQYWCQLGTGLPALPALVQRERQKRKKPALLEDASGSLHRFMAPPRPFLEKRDLTTGRVIEQQPFRSHDQNKSPEYPDGRTVVHPDELAKWNHDLHHFYELGTVYTMIAGLLNILVAYDAAAGPLVLIPEPKRKKPPKTVASSGAGEPQPQDEIPGQPEKAPQEVQS